MGFNVVHDGGSLAEGGCESLRFPDAGGLSQDREWVEARVDGEWRRFRLHDYDTIYAVPGLYETLYQRSLHTTSPTRVVSLLGEMLAEYGVPPGSLRVLDAGAGNGMVAYELRNLGVDKIIGVDISEEARRAALRDRPWCYDDYLALDLTEIPKPAEARLLRAGFNALTCVAALGFMDMPAAAFINAVDLIQSPGWLAFNIKEDFVQERDDSDFAVLLRELAREDVIQMETYRRYRLRDAIDGTPLHYVAIVARKIKDVPASIRDGAALSRERPATHPSQHSGVSPPV